MLFFRLGLEPGDPRIALGYKRKRVIDRSRSSLSGALDLSCKRAESRQAGLTWLGIA